MEITVLFFGMLAEVSGVCCKKYSGVISFGDLDHRIKDEFPEITHYLYRIAVNKEIADEYVILKDGDEIAYLPPFSGG